MPLFVRVAWLLVLACALVPGRAGAQIDSTLCTPEDDCPTLRLDAFLERVLRANPQIRALGLEDERAVAGLLDARGGFDPLLLSGYEYKTEEDKDKLNVLRSGLSLPFDVLMSPSLTLDYRRGLGSSVDPSVATSFDGETRLGLTLTPLQGLFTNKRRATLQKARLEPRRANAIQAAGRNLLLLEATGAFWSWTEANRVLQINRDLLDLAVRRLDFVRRRARVGEAAAIDSVEAELSVVSRQGKVAEAVRKAEQAGVKLSVFLWEADGTPAAFDFAPPPVPSLPTVTDEAVRAAAERALTRRPELQEIGVKLEQLRVEQRLARERLRPKLLLEAQAVAYDADFGETADVKFGLKIDQPLLFRSARGTVENARVDVLQLDFKRDLTERKVLADVDVAVVALRQAERRVAIAERRVTLARRLQEAEQRRFELGESTLFLVNQREQAFAQAREELVTAQADVLRAYAAYQWSTGIIADDLPAVGF
jgi:outer membrane protein TolC